MLDTHTCSYIIRESPIGVLERFRKLAVERSSSKRINRPQIGAMDMMIATHAKSLKTR